jgi:hypothetical protein
MTGDDTNRLSTGVGRRKRSAGSLHTLHFHVPSCALVLAAMLSMAAVTSTLGQATSSVEYQLKAAFLLNFAKFVEWPSGTFQNESAPIILCVFRQDPFGRALDEIIRNKTIDNREVQARRINELPDLKSCQIVFVSSVEDKHLPEILSSLKGASGLVAGEGEDFAERGGGIQFFVEDNKLRFAINVDAIQRARLTVSSKLLALAKIIHDQGHSKGK